MQMMNITLDEEKWIYHKWSSYKTANDNVYFHDSWLSTHVGPVRHDDVIKWKHFPRYWPFVRGIHRSLVNSPHKGQWHGAVMVSLICAWINGWVNNREPGDFRRHQIQIKFEWILWNCCCVIEPRQKYWYQTTLESGSFENKYNALGIILILLSPVRFEWNFTQVIFQLISMIDSWGISCEIALRWLSLDLTDDKSTMLQVMV